MSVVPPSDAGAHPPRPSSEPLPAVPPQPKSVRCADSGGLELHSTLDRICRTAADLADARYAAIGIVAEDGNGLADFVHHGVDETVARRIGRFPDGHRGLFGALVHDPVPVRLGDLTADPRSCGFPPHHPPMTGFVGAPIRAQGKIFGSLCVTEKRGGGSFDDADLTVVRVLAGEAGIAIGNVRLYEAARQRERWIDGSVAVTTALLSGGDAHDALQVVAEQARRLSGSVAGTVLLPAADGGLETVAVASDRPSDLLGAVLPARSAIVAELLAGQPVFMDDVAADGRLRTEYASGYGPVMMVPLQSDGRVLGALVMPRARGERPFTGVERSLAVQFAARAALALMMAGAQRDRERLAVFEERDRIARDLHDLVIQRLFATGTMLASAQRRSVVPEVREGVGKAVDELDVTIQEIRAAIFALQQDPAEVSAGLRTRILREIDMAAVPLGFRPTYRFVGAVDTLVGDDTGRNLIAVLREALSNAFRHAGASRIEVVVDATATLPTGRPGVRLTVADDGVGVAVAEAGRRSGLRNLERRAEFLGGDSRLGPGIGPDGAGTTVVWQAPF
ncbi:GAF domain-containing sensor histidine kinase [Streptomyces sp. MMS24-I2-30]|uniref:GAF domain-containing sensor histidine kinase n=1 Tax=Streptomyces sp. MMS24-I2-30 TaxID=3351564 RepID=UPI00389690A4